MDDKPLTKDEVQKMIDDAIVKREVKNQFQVSQPQYHTHSGTDSPLLASYATSGFFGMSKLYYAPTGPSVPTDDYKGSLYYNTTTDVPQICTASGTWSAFGSSSSTAPIYILGVDSSASSTGMVKVSGSFITSSGDWFPKRDNTNWLGTGSTRWANVNSVLINGADIGFANGWKLREHPLDVQDVSQPKEWMREHANGGIQLLDDKDRVIAVFTRDGIFGDFRPLSDIRTEGQLG